MASLVLVILLFKSCFSGFNALCRTSVFFVFFLFFVFLHFTVVPEFDRLSWFFEPFSRLLLCFIKKTLCCTSLFVFPPIRLLDVGPWYLKGHKKFLLYTCSLHPLSLNSLLIRQNICPILFFCYSWDSRQWPEIKPLLS